MIINNYNYPSISFNARITSKTLKRVRCTVPELDGVVEHKIGEIRKWGDNNSKYSVLSIEKTSDGQREAFYISDGKDLEHKWRVSSKFSPDGAFVNFMSITEYEIRTAQQCLATIDKQRI